ncbi:ABC transporter permease, partial [Candidatus Bathyarchaeota archaeon]|nr:ABC transporter permease [Candidatus Bathyarchaeota archaeon]
EAWFEADSAIGIIPIRAVDPNWRGVAYIEEGWIEGADALDRMNSSETSAMLERGAAELLGVRHNGTMLIKLGARVHPLTIVGIFGKKPPMGWTVQNPTLYVPLSFLNRIEESDIKRVRILVRLKDGVNLDEFSASIMAMDPNIEGIDIADLKLREASSNIFLTGSRRIEEIGVYIASVISSVGVALVVSTGLRSRWKEIVVMAIRGFSMRQLTSILALEYLSSTLLAIVLGSAVGIILLRGEIEMFNSLSQASIWRRMVFPVGAQLSLSAILGLIQISVVIPILFAARRASLHPIWTLEE